MMDYRICYLPDASPEELQLWLEEAGEEKRCRLRAFRKEQDRLRSLCADHLARQMLSEATGIARDSLVFLMDERGKPFLKDNSLYFNVSHAGNYAACTVSEFPVGIDIEVPRPIRPELCRKVCAEEEYAFVYPGGSFSPERFLQLWTAKEAYFKQSGEGLRCDLRSVCLVADEQLSFPSPLKGLFRSEAEYFLSIAYR